jgi:hypothetical protein
VPVIRTLVLSQHPTEGLHGLCADAVGVLSKAEVPVSIPPAKAGSKRRGSRDARHPRSYPSGSGRTGRPSKERRRSAVMYDAAQGESIARTALVSTLSYDPVPRP